MLSNCRLAATFQVLKLIFCFSNQGTSTRISQILLFLFHNAIRGSVMTLRRDGRTKIKWRLHKGSRTLPGKRDVGSGKCNTSWISDGMITDSERIQFIILCNDFRNKQCLGTNWLNVQYLIMIWSIVISSEHPLIVHIIDLIIPLTGLTTRLKSLQPC